MRLRPLIAALPVILVAACGSPSSDAPAEDISTNESAPAETPDLSPLEAAISSPLRSEAEIARDVYRHPSGTA